MPTLTAEENILLPLAIAGRKPDPEWYDAVIDTVGLARPARATGPTSSPAASSSASPWPGRWSAGRAIVFADEPTGNLDSRSGAEVLDAAARAASTSYGQTVVMVTHDPVAAAYTDRVVFLADGRVVDELRDPDRERGARDRWRARLDRRRPRRRPDRPCARSPGESLLGAQGAAAA